MVVHSLSTLLAASPHLRLAKEFPGPLVGGASSSSLASFLTNAPLIAEAAAALGVTDPLHDVMLLHQALLVGVVAGGDRRVGWGVGTEGWGWRRVHGV